MRNFRVLIFFMLITVMLFTTAAVLGQDGSGDIIVNGADEARTISTVDSQELNDVTSDVVDHIVYQYADEGLLDSLVGVSNDLKALVEQTSNHIVFQYADSNKYLNLIPIPDELKQTLYPTDTTPPTGNFSEPARDAIVVAPVWLRAQVKDNPGGSGIAKVRFTTNCTGPWTLIAIEFSPPYEELWDMAGVPDGIRCMLGMEIYDNAGNRKDSIRWITRK